MPAVRFQVGDYDVPLCTGFYRANSQDLSRLWLAGYTMRQIGAAGADFVMAVTRSLGWAVRYQTAEAVKQSWKASWIQTKAAFYAFWGIFFNQWANDKIAHLATALGYKAGDLDAEMNAAAAALTERDQARTEKTQAERERAVVEHQKDAALAAQRAAEERLAAMQAANATIPQLQQTITDQSTELHRLHSQLSEMRGQNRQLVRQTSRLQFDVRARNAYLQYVASPQVSQQVSQQISTLVLEDSVSGERLIPMASGRQADAKALSSFASAREGRDPLAHIFRQLEALAGEAVSIMKQRYATASQNPKDALLMLMRDSVRGFQAVQAVRAEGGDGAEMASTFSRALVGGMRVSSSAQALSSRAPSGDASPQERMTYLMNQAVYTDMSRAQLQDEVQQQANPLMQAFLAQMAQQITGQLPANMAPLVQLGAHIASNQLGQLVSANGSPRALPAPSGSGSSSNSLASFGTALALLAQARNVAPGVLSQVVQVASQHFSQEVVGLAQSAAQLASPQVSASSSSSASSSASGVVVSEIRGDSRTATFSRAPTATATPSRTQIQHNNNPMGRALAEV